MSLTLEDRLEILELAARYNIAVDRRDAESWADLFTPDGEIWADGRKRAIGRAELVEHVRRAERTGQRIRHCPCNHVIEGDGSTARLVMYVVAWDITDGGMRPQLLAEYDDTLRKVDGRWRFVVRRITGVAGSFPSHVAPAPSPS